MLNAFKYAIDGGFLQVLRLSQAYGELGKTGWEAIEKESVFFHHSRGNTFWPVKKRNAINLSLYVKT